MHISLKERLETLAAWHQLQGDDYGNHPSITLRSQGSMHLRAAADIRAAIVSADDATKNLLTFRHHLAERRKYAAEPEAITGFDQLEGKS